MHCTAFTPWYFQDKYLASQSTKSSTKNIQVLSLFYLNAARYSASPIGGSSPPVKAMFTLKPTPGPLPTCKTHIHARLGYNVRINTGSGYADRPTGVHSYLIRCSTAREEVPIIIAMQWQVENTGVCVEGLLGAITMVNILDTTEKEEVRA